MMLPANIEAAKILEHQEHLKREERVKALRARFDGAIRYYPMLQQHPEWTDDECIARARELHTKAVAQFKERGAVGWNWGIPYCRNDHTKARLEQPT